MRRATVALAVFVFVVGFTRAAQAAEIQGRVVIQRVLTKKRVTIPNYQMRGMALDAAKPAESAPSIAAEYDKVVVYLEKPGEPARPVDSSTPAATLMQRGGRFEPELIVIPVGSTVIFPNGDPIFHNVFSLSAPKKFDLGYYPKGGRRSITFDRPGVVQVFCHLHPDMNAAIVVTPTPWYSRLAADGKFAFRDLPPGEYQVVVWHRSTGFFRQHVHLNDDSSEELNFAIPLPAQ